MRCFLLAALMLVPAVCVAQKAKPKPKVNAPQSLVKSVGDRFVTTAPIIVAIDEFESIELAKSIAAEDKEGVKQMVDEKKAITLASGVELVVLEISTVDRRREDKSSLCRVVQNGKAIGKYPVHYTWFTTASMKKTKDIDVFK
jgi:hypothetical protein